ncbi:MAG: hypothetical protein ACYDEY_04950 [Acidimicrobiales bacterium]
MSPRAEYHGRSSVKEPVAMSIVPSDDTCDVHASRWDRDSYRMRAHRVRAEKLVDKGVLR